MRKTLVLVLFALLSIGAVWGQYVVNFDGTGETKTAYASGSVTLSGTSWNMTEALIGTETAEIIAGIRSARLRGYGTSSMSMLADKANGIGSISFQYRRYGTDAQVDWKVEYSTDGGANWTQVGSAFTAPATTDIVTFNETVNVSGNVRVRIKRATETGTSNRRLNIDNIEITDYTGGSTTPTIIVTGSLSAFSTITGSPSTAQSYTLSGTNLTANIDVLAPAGFVLSTDQSAWNSSLSLASTFNGLVYVRLTGATAGSYNGNITHNSTGASEITLAASGTVTDPVPAINITGTTTTFSATTGTPSVAQNYSVSGAFLSNDITITPPAGFEVSLASGSGYASSLVLPHSGGTVNATTIYLRLTGVTAGSYSGDVTHVAGATSANLAVSGTVTDPAGPTMFLEENFAYTAGTTLVSNGWIAHSGAGSNSPVVALSGLVYPDYPAAVGLAGQTLGNGEDVHKNFEPQATGVVYNSVLINVTNTTTTGAYIYHLATNENSTTNHKGRIWVKKDASNNLSFGFQKQTTTVWTDFLYSLNTTYLFVIKYEILEGAANDVTSLWINPVVGAAETTPTLTATSTETDIGALGLGSVAIRQSNDSITAIFDGIRVTNNWDLLWSGEAPEDPVLYVSTNELDPLVAIVNTPSDEIRSYTLSGTDLQGPITVTAPIGFQVSDNETEGWDSQIQVPSTFDGLIYVRMLASISGEYSGEITNASLNATSLNVAVSGEAIEPPTTWNITANLTSFSTEAGTPSAAQSYSLSATDPTDNLSVVATIPFELSTNQIDYSSSLNLAPSFNGSVYVRMNSAVAGDFQGTITHTTANASPYEIQVSGNATAIPGNYAEELFFSEYTEAASGNNKLLEIFNGTGSPVDLSVYSVKLATNGGAWSTTLPLTGTLVNNDVFIIANASSTAELLAIADVTSGVTFYNGDDALGLFKNDILIDVIGVQGVDPGDGWAVAGVANATKDRTLIRKPTVIVGNLDFIAGAGTNADDSEWIVMPWNDYSNLGTHTFTPGLQMAATPEITPAGGLYYSAVQVNITASTPGSVIRYTTDGNEPDETSTQYTAPIQVSADTTIKARAYATGFAPSAIAIATYSFPVQVANIAALRAMPTGTTVYHLTGEAILTFQQSTRNQKYIQDATAAIVIDDAAGVITTVYNLYDGITGVSGTLGTYSGLLQFTPVTNTAAATSTGNVVVPEVRTLASLTSADQAKLIKVLNVTIDATSGNFLSAAQNINVTDPSGAAVMRTFPATDYSSTPIPTVAQDIICLAGDFNGTMQISPRFLSDFSNSVSGELEAPVVTISNVGSTINLNWNAVAGAGSYRVEGSSNPYNGFTTLNTTTDQTWSGLAEGMMFFRVIALP